jgi:inhibitor of cysteine peptidase
MKLRDVTLFVLIITFLVVAGCTPGPVADDDTVVATPGGALPTVDDTVEPTPRDQRPADDGTATAPPGDEQPRSDETVVATPGGSTGQEDPSRPVTSDELPLPPMPPSKPSVGENVIVGEAVVGNIDIAILESFPVQVMVTAEGDLPDGCTTISHAEQSIDGNTITVKLYTARPAEMLCTMALVPYIHNISLDVVGLTAGDYTVDVNGATGAFNLAVDNIRQ